jgi:predicted alpha/beta hydrolase family esterase
MMQPTILLVPGLRDHVPEHWQTHLEAKLPNARSVQPLTRDKLSLAARVKQLDAAIAACPQPVILVAHSAGVMMVAHWAKAHRRPIFGALLVAPPDLENPLPEGYPQMDDLKANGWLPTPNQRLPFASIVGVSTNDPLCALDRSTDMARKWGSRVVNLGAVGHVNPASGHGEWPRAEALIQEFTLDLVRQ